jgi:hypothetical protein
LIHQIVPGAAMSTKLRIFAAALLMAGPVLAAAGASSGGSSSSGGGGGGGGGHGGGGGGGGGHMGGGGSGAGFGGRGAAASARAAIAAHGDTLENHGAHASAMHAVDAMAGKHAAAEHEHETSKLAGTDHRHHHPNRREPDYWGWPAQYGELCDRVPDASNPWFNCYGPTKSPKGHT